MSTVQQLLTAEAFFEIEGNPEISELVRGVVAHIPPPGFRHGLICGQIAYVLRRFLDEHDVGRVLCNDSGVITQRDPDTVRGGDVAFYSYERLARDVTPVGYPQVSPNIVFEVRSPTDPWSEILEKTAEYLSADVELVCVLVPETCSAHLFYPDRPGVILQGDEELSLPAPLKEFHQPVSDFFKNASA